MVSCQCEEPVGGSTSTVPAGKLAAPATDHLPPSYATNPPTVDPKQNINLLKQPVLEKESVHISTPAGIGTAGIIMDTVSSDKFGAVIGFLERFVKLCDGMSEVSFCIASDFYFHIEMLAGASICKACVDRADH
jgi:hypothetical protein